MILSVCLFISTIEIFYVNRFWHNNCSYTYIARIIILRDGRKLKLKHKIILVTRLALVSSFLFADDVSIGNQTKATPLEQTDPNYGWESASEFYNDIPYSEQDDIDYSGMTTMSRDGETIYQFTNCGQIGRTGPSQSQANSSYSGTNLDGSVSVSGGIQS